MVQKGYVEWMCAISCEQCPQAGVPTPLNARLPTFAEPTRAHPKQVERTVPCAPGLHQLAPATHPSHTGTSDGWQETRQCNPVFVSSPTTLVRWPTAMATPTSALRRRSPYTPHTPSPQPPAAHPDPTSSSPPPPRQTHSPPPPPSPPPAPSRRRLHRRRRLYRPPLGLAAAASPPAPAPAPCPAPMPSPGRPRGRLGASGRWSRMRSAAPPGGQGW